MVALRSDVILSRRTDRPRPPPPPIAVQVQAAGSSRRAIALKAFAAVTAAAAVRPAPVRTPPPTNTKTQQWQAPVLGPGRYCSPRHRMPSNSRNEGSQCVSMTWRGIFACPWPAAAVAALDQYVVGSDS